MADQAVEIQLQQPAGPVANAYGQSRARVAAIVGPTGGGKTTESVKRIIRIAQWQDPSPRDGIRKARIVCVGPTYRRLWDTAIPSYREAMQKFGWLKVGKDPNFTGSVGDPAQHVFDLETLGHGRLHIEVYFRAVQEMALEDFVRGLQCTAWWNPEMDTLPEDLIGLELNRVGRYPEPDDRPDGSEVATYGGVFGDANVPDIDDWFYDRFWLSHNRPPGWHLFLQPPGVMPGGPPWHQNPDAENLQNLRKIDPRYYETQANDAEVWAARRFLMCKPGYSRHGEPVHKDFDDEKHVAKAEIPVDPYQPVVIGLDGGGNTNLPGGALMQRSYRGHWRALAEIAPHQATSAGEVGQEIRRLLSMRIKRAKGAVIFIDPAAAIRSPLSPFTYAQQVQAASGVEVRMAPSQDPRTRRAALSRKGGPLQATIDGEPGFLVDPSCTSLIKSLAGGFRYRKQAKAKGSLEVEKNIHSHVAEGVEYGVLGGDGDPNLEGGLFGPDGEDGTADLYPEPILA